MTISVADAGKRYNREWIFRHFTFTFETGSTYAITGPNGSGKSTLLQTISGSMMINEGKIEYSDDVKKIPAENVYLYNSFCAPYLELIEEMSLEEFLNFHQQFKSFLPGLNTTDIINELGLQAATKKQIRNFSSGMKQRVKLAQCICSDTPVILLDEPCTNLDAKGIELYLSLINKYGKNRTILVSSNDKTEYSFCKELINITRYKNGQQGAL